MFKILSKYFDLMAYIKIDSTPLFDHFFLQNWSLVISKKKLKLLKIKFI